MENKKLSMQKICILAAVFLPSPAFAPFKAIGEAEKVSHFDLSERLRSQWSEITINLCARRAKAAPARG